MTRISTTQVAVGDTIRTFTSEGIVTRVGRVHDNMTTFTVDVDTPDGMRTLKMNDAGSVIRLS